jgi:hypothetical protein
VYAQTIVRHGLVCSDVRTSDDKFVRVKSAVYLKRTLNNGHVLNVVASALAWQRPFHSPISAASTLYRVGRIADGTYERKHNGMSPATDESPIAN